MLNHLNNLSKQFISSILLRWYNMFWFGGKSKKRDTEIGDRRREFCYIIYEYESKFQILKAVRTYAWQKKGRKAQQEDKKNQDFETQQHKVFQNYSYLSTKV